MKNSQVNSDIYIISGKGGVGKSTVAAAWAQELVRRGFKTLLVEMGPDSHFKYVFNKEFGYVPSLIDSGLHVCVLSGESCLREFIAHYIRIPAVVDLFFDNRVMKTLVRAAPALQELSVLGKLTSRIREFGPPLIFDKIVVDCYSSGHFLSLMRVPGAMAKAIPLGPMGQQSRAIEQVLMSSNHCQYWLVTTSEELPIQETLETWSQLKNEFGVRACVVHNRTLNDVESIIDKDKVCEESSFAGFIKKWLNVDRQARQRLSEFTEARCFEVPFSLIPEADQRVSAVAECLSKISELK